MTDPLDTLRRSLAATIRGVGLPQDERECGVFLAGLAYGLVIYVTVLVGVSWLTAKALGWPL